MAIFYTDSASFNSLVVTGSTIISASSNNESLKLIGSGSNIFSVTGSGGGIFAITDTSPSDSSLFSVSSGSTTIFSVDLLKKVTISGSTVMTGSLNVTTGITGSLFGTASWATNALTASYFGGSVISASYAATSSWALNFLTSSVTSASYAASASYLISGATASYASTASLALNFITSSVTSASYVSSSGIYGPNGYNSILTASYALTASYVANASSFPYTGSARITGSLDVIGSTSITGSLNVTGSTIFNVANSNFAISGSVNISGSTTQQGNNTLTGNTILSGSVNISGSTTQQGNNTLTGNTILSGSIQVSGSQTFVGINTITGSVNISGSTKQVGNNNLLGNTVLSGSIVISASLAPGNLSASVNIYGDTALSGFLRFNPYSTNIDSSISASYIYVSGSTNDLYFSQNGQGYSNTTRLRWIEGNLYSGLLNGALITTQSSTVYQIASGSGIIVSLNASTTTNPYPTIQYINWPNLSASIAPLTSSYDQQFVAVLSDGTIDAQGTPYSDGDYNSKIPIGIIIHQNRSTINATQTFPSVGYGWKQRSFDFIKAFGPLKISGYGMSPSGSSTGSLVVAGGTAWVDGRNYIVDPNNPSYIVEGTAISTSKIYRYYQSGSNWKYDTNGGLGYQSIDPTNYSNNGVLTPVPTNDWSIQRVFYFPNSATKALYIYYGNAAYANESLALAAINTENFTEAPNTTANAIYLGALIVRYNADFTNVASYNIYPGGLFRGSGAGGGTSGGGVTSLASLSDVSITSPTNYQPFAYNSVTTKWENRSIISASLKGNADTATLAQTASYFVTSSVTSASFATSASWAENAGNASTIDINVFGSPVDSYLLMSNVVGTTGVAIGGDADLRYNASTNKLTVGTVSATSLTGSLFGTASWAQNSLTASYFITSSVTSASYISSSGVYGPNGYNSILTASYVSTASWALNFATSSVTSASYAATASSADSFNVRTSLTASSALINGTITAQTLVVNVVSSSIDYSSGSNIFGSLLTNTHQFTGSVSITGSLSVVGAVSASSFTGSIFGTSSWARNSLSASYFITSSVTSASYAATASYFITSSVTSASIATMAATASSVSQLNQSVIITGSLTVSGSSGTSLFSSNIDTLVLTGSAIITGSVIITGSLSILGSITGSLFGTASWAQNFLTSSVTSASFASTASSVNILNQNVLITGSLTIGSSSIGSNENTLVLGPSPAGGAGEGGQILLQAPGGTYTSASMFDNWQNYTRLLRGTNVSSDAVVTQWNMHSKQVAFPAYNNTTAFTGTTLVGLLGFDSNGNILTTTTGSGGSGVSITNNTDNYILTATGTANSINGESNLQFNGSTLSVTGNVTATSITSSGAIISLANNAMYFRGGDDAEFWDINIVNTVGLYGQQDQTVGSIKLGNNGGILSGRSGSIGIGTTLPVSGTLQVNGNVYANSFTGSLQGTASWAQNFITSSVTNALSSSYAATASSADSFNVRTSLTASSALINGTITAQTLVVQTITSSVEFITGSSKFGSLLTDTHQFTGSVSISSSLNITGQLTATGITGSLFGTSSWARNSLTASYFITSSVTNATSASFAATASYFITSSVTSASFSSTSSNILGGTANYIPLWSGATTLSSSIMYQSSSNVGIGTTIFDTNNPETLLISGSTINTVIGKNNINNYTQLNIVNKSAGTAASSDIVATNDTGNESGNFVDLGINSSAFSGLIGAANEAYLYTTGSNFLIGNITRGNASLKLFSGNDATIFPIIVTGSNAIITGSLLGTASFAATASYFITSSITSASFSTSASFASTSSWALNFLTSSVTSASYAVSASIVDNAITAQSASNFNISNTLVIDQTLTDFASVASTAFPAPNNIFTQATGSYRSVFIKYTAYTGSSAARSGEVIASWNGGVVTYTDFSTVDVGDTTGVVTSVSLAGNDVQFNVTTPAAKWTIKSLVTFI